jgi:hypothetical protein
LIGGVGVSWCFCIAVSNIQEEEFGFYSAYYKFCLHIWS